MDKLRLQIITPERTVFNEEVDEVILPTLDGEIGVLPHHVPLLSIIKPGEVRIKKGLETIFMATYGGCIEVYPGGIRVLADSAERAEEIDEMRAIEARKRAESLMKEAQDDVAFADAAAYLERNLVRLKVAERKRRHLR
ncbi:MAG: F0F1 ATP synthase subunit epsilon [bacterium]|nr:F0F1 ATP synthase subunit epsilon [bacterium]